MFWILTATGSKPMSILASRLAASRERPYAGMQFRDEQ